jgi:hypothetical protein
MKGVHEIINNSKISLCYISDSGDQIFTILVSTPINPLDYGGISIIPIHN